MADFIRLDALNLRREMDVAMFAGGGKPTFGLTNGCYDLLHPGHVAMLEDCAAQCDLLVVAIDDDERVRALKGPRCPWRPLRDRARVVAALRAVWRVVPITATQRLDDIMRILQPAWYFCRLDEEVPEEATALGLGINVRPLGRHGAWSTSEEMSRWQSSNSSP